MRAASGGRRSARDCQKMAVGRSRCDEPATASLSWISEFEHRALLQVGSRANGSGGRADVDFACPPGHHHPQRVPRLHQAPFRADINHAQLISFLRSSLSSVRTELETRASHLRTYARLFRARDHQFSSHLPSSRSPTTLGTRSRLPNCSTRLDTCRNRLAAAHHQ